MRTYWVNVLEIFQGYLPLLYTATLSSRKKVCTLFLVSIAHYAYLVPKSRSEHVHYNCDFKFRCHKNMFLSREWTRC